MPKRKVKDNDNVSLAKEKKKRKSCPQGVYWHFTEYNMDWKPPVPYPEGTPEDDIKIRYLVYQHEKCPLTQKDHYQGYVQLYKKKYYTQVQQILGLSSCTNVSLERKDPTASILYATKLETRAIATDQPFTFGIPSLVGAKGGKSKTLSNFEETNLAYANANKCETKEEALAIIKQQAPRDSWIHLKQIQYAADYYYAPPPYKWIARYPNYPWLIPPEIKNWIQQELPLTERCKCLIVVGETRYAKTEWARHLFPESHMYFRNEFSLAEWDPNAKLMIFDDVEWKYIPCKKLLLTHMGEGICHDRYMRKKKIVVTMPAIVLLNDYPEIPRYWAKNTVVVDLRCPMAITPQIIKEQISWDTIYQFIADRFELPVDANNKVHVKPLLDMYNNSELGPVNAFSLMRNRKAVPVYSGVPSLIGPRISEDLEIEQIVAETDEILRNVNK